MDDNTSSGENAHWPVYRTHNHNRVSPKGSKGTKELRLEMT